MSVRNIKYCEKLTQVRCLHHEVLLYSKCTANQK